MRKKYLNIELHIKFIDYKKSIKKKITLII